MSTDRARTRRDVTSALPNALLTYVERAAGTAAVGEVLMAAGIDPDDARFSSEDRWVSGPETVALAEAAAVLCGDSQIGRRTGEEYFRIHMDRGVIEFVRSQSDPAAAIAFSAEYSNRMGTGNRHYEVRRTGATDIVVDFSCDEHPIDRHWFWCQIALGYWSQIPSLYGAVGAVTEPRCASRGDEGCELVVRWDQAARLDEDRRTDSRQRSDRMVRRFEDLQSMGAEMATAEDVPTVLERIVELVSIAIMAPRFVLTVRRHADDDPEVFSVGFDDADARHVSESLWAGGAPETFGVPLVVPVASHRANYGHLVAFLPPGATVTEVDRRLLAAYAGHATAALERVVALQAAQRDHRATAALLGLSEDLATARSVPDIAERVTAATPEVVDCDVAGVWLLDPDSSSYRLQSYTSSWHHTGSAVFPLGLLEDPGGLAEHPRPMVIDRSTPDARAARILAEWGVQESYLAPIVHRGQLHGLLAAASSTTVSRRADRDRTLANLTAVAHHASTAIGNAMLLAQVRHQASHDALTGLPNRPQIEERVEQELRNAAQAGKSVALAFVDLDRFKKVNDTLGHAAGDELIRVAAARLQDSVRADDIVARLSGDEFLVMLPLSSGSNDAEVVARKILSALRQPFSVAGESLFISASVGIACYPDHGTDYGTLLAHADAAMYDAKARGRNTFALYAKALSSEAHELLTLENDLHRALDRDELSVRFQPQVEMATGTIVAAEALVRWMHPTRGELGPPEFLQIAEDSGLIVDIDRWVRGLAFAQARTWSDAGIPIRVAVNLSTRDLHNPGLPDEIRAQLSQLELDPQLVELEVTDRIVMADDEMPEWLRGLSSLGVRLAIDDFGTGNSVLSRLHRCPMDVLKIDRSFIEPIRNTGADVRLIDALISIAHALGMEVVSEGIETERQASLLAGLGSELAQGFHFHRPMPADELTGLLRAQRGLDDALYRVPERGRNGTSPSA